MVTGRGRDVLGVAVGRPRRGKWRTGRRERKSLRSRSELEPPEVNTTPVSRAEWEGCSGPFFELPGMGGVGWGENGRIWRSSGQVLGPDEPRARPVRPAAIWAHLASLPRGSWPLFVTSCPSGRPGCEEKGDEHQKQGSISGWDQGRRCRSRSRHTGDAHNTKHAPTLGHPAVAAGTGRRPSFRQCRPLT